MAQVITADEAREIGERNAAYNAWSAQFVRPNGWTVIPADAVPPVKITNDERGKLEQYRFHQERPAAYFLYINEGEGRATTWTGDTLGAVSFGREYRDNFGGKRVPITVRAINGAVYHGTYYKSSGDYARVKISKRSA